MKRIKTLVVLWVALSAPLMLRSEEAARIYLDVLPRTATCYVDGVMVDHRDPVSVTRGNHQVKATHPGYPDYLEAVSVDSDSVLVRIFPIKINYSPPEASLRVNGSKVLYDDRSTAYLFSNPGMIDIKLIKGLRLKRKQGKVITPYSEYQIGMIVRPRQEELVWGHFLSPELAFYPSSGIVELQVASLGVKSEGAFGKTKLHYGFGVIDASVYSSNCYALTLFPCEAGLAYTSRNGYNRYALVYKMDILNMDFGPKSNYLGTYNHTDPDDEYVITGHDAYRFDDAYCIMMPDKSLAHRICLSYNRYLSDRIDLSVSLGISISPTYTWFRADNWDVDESARQYLGAEEILATSPFPEGSQMFLSIALRPLTFNRGRR